MSKFNLGETEYLGKDKKTLFWKNGKIEKRRVSSKKDNSSN